MAHALLSPSAAHRWMRCPGSLSLERNEPNTSSKFADEGTAAHELAAWALEAGNDAAAYLGRIIDVDGNEFVVDEDMAGNVQVYIDAIRERIENYKKAGAVDVELRVERRVDFSHVVNVPESFGTADAQIIVTWPDGTVTIDTNDLKYGRGVKVDADENEQLMIYNVGLGEEIALVAEIREAVHVIHQPRLNHVSEWACTAINLVEFSAKVHEAAARAIGIIEVGAEPVDFTPGDKQCRFCKAKATCSALTNHVLGVVADDFVDLAKPIAPQLSTAVERVENSDSEHLAACMAAVDIVEQWTKAVRAKAESELLAGRPVPGFKLVEGRRGPRKWANEADAEATMKAMRLKHEVMYDYSLISPTTAEKLAKSEAIGPRQWPRLQELITQADGKPSVAPASDKRPALVMTAVENDFADESAADLV